MPSPDEQSAVRRRSALAPLYRRINRAARARVGLPGARRKLGDHIGIGVLYQLVYPSLSDLWSALDHD